MVDNHQITIKTTNNASNNQYIKPFLQPPKEPSNNQQKFSHICYIAENLVYTPSSAAKNLKKAQKKEMYLLSEISFIGLRERGSEGIACPKGVSSPLRGYPNIVHRPIGRFVVSGRNFRHCNSAWRFDDVPVCSGILLSPCREAVNSPSMCLVYDCFPPLSSCQKQKRDSPLILPFIPPLFSSEKKRRTCIRDGTLQVLQDRKEFFL